MKSNNVIEINGKLYDAKSGVPINATSVNSTLSAKSAAPIKSNHSNQRSVDGFSRQKSPKNMKTAMKTTARAPKTVAVTQQKVVAAPKAAAPRSTAPTMKRAAGRSTTLYRSALQAPKAQASSTPIKVSEPATKLSSTAFKHADEARFKRAQHVTKSTFVAKFNQRKSEPTTITEKPALKNPAQPQPSLTKHLTQTHQPAKTIPASNESKVSTKERLIKKALANVAVTDSTKSKKNRKFGNLGKYATSGLVAVVLAGYVAYLNVPSISMNIAAHRAGFAATMPGYKPSGYSLKGPIAYTPGQVTVSFHSNTDNRAFSLKQQPTTWDSTALLENYVTKQSPNYLTYQDRGLTIYIYDGSSASWINGGKLYNVDGKNAQLDTDQLLKLATSV